MPTSEHHIWLSPLEEELVRARELEFAGRKHLATQETRVARLKAKNVNNSLSHRLLDTMRITHKLQISHVELLEREVREASEMAG
jgi:hypothetical protein